LVAFVAWHALVGRAALVELPALILLLRIFLPVTLDALVRRALIAGKALLMALVVALVSLIHCHDDSSPHYSTWNCGIQPASWEIQAEGDAVSEHFIKQEKIG
jgi:hypothetical protein